MDYTQLSDAELNLEVAKIMYAGDVVYTPYKHRDDAEVFHKNGLSTMVAYCNFWKDAGPIIENNQISLDSIYEGGPRWLSFAGEDGQFRHVNSNPLRASMIVFLMMQENKDE